MQSKNVWRSLKAVGNNVKFQFLLPSELAAVVSNNKSMPVGRRMKNPNQLHVQICRIWLIRPSWPYRWGFSSGREAVPQISPKQLGPFAHGVALMSMEEASPYLKAGRGVSSELWPLLCFAQVSNHLHCLPHTKVMIPCVCIANKEPLLTEAIVVQLGTGFVRRKWFARPSHLISLMW